MTDKKILVTGACGFIGSHLTELLVRRGYSVIAFDRYNINNSWGWLDTSDIKKDVEVLLGDVRDYDSVYNALSSCDSVIHLAALIGIPYSYISPLAYIKTNIEGTYNILEASKKLNLSQIIITSTSETYGSAVKLPMNEEHTLSGQSPYSASKISCDFLTQSYNLSFNLPTKIVKPFNTYGPRQSPRAIIPSIILQMLSEVNEIKLGNLSPLRDFTYVEDTVSGILEVFNCSNLFGQITNIGMNQNYSIEEVFLKIKEILNSKVIIREDHERKRNIKSEVNNLLCDNSKILKNTNWKPKFNIDEGLNKTIKWFVNNSDFFKSNIYNV